MPMPTDVYHCNPMPVQSFSKMPIIAVDRVEDRRALGVRAGQRDKYAIVRVEILKGWVIGKFDVVCFSYRMNRKGNLRNTICSVAIVN